MTGTAVTIAGAETTAKNGAIVLSAEQKKTLNSLGQAWEEAWWQLATYTYVRDDSWAEKVIQGLNGGKLSVTTIAAGYQSVSQADQDAEKQRKALEQFIETALRRIELIALDAPEDASNLLKQWMNRLAARVADLADQASTLTQAHVKMVATVGRLSGDAGTPVFAKRLQDGITQMQQLLAKVTSEGSGTPTSPAPLTLVEPNAATAGSLEKIVEQTDEGLSTLRKQTREAERQLAREARRAATSLRRSITAEVRKALAGELKKSVPKAVRAAVRRQVRSTARNP